MNAYSMHHCWFSTQQAAGFLHDCADITTVKPVTILLMFNEMPKTKTDG